MFPRESPYLPVLKIALVLAVLALVCSYTPWGIYVLLALVFGLVALGVVIMMVCYARVLYLRWRLPERRVRAVVARKWTREYDYDVPKSSPGIASYLQRTLPWSNGPTATIYQQWVFWVSFRTDSGDLDFAVPEHLYINLEEGTKGVLSHQSDKFVGFRPEPRPGL